MSKFPLKPLRNMVVLKTTIVKEVTEGGIFLPGNATQSKPEQGEVMAIGEKVEGIPIGSKVLFSKYSPTEAVLDDETYLILRDEDVLALITN